MQAAGNGRISLGSAPCVHLLLYMYGLQVINRALMRSDIDKVYSTIPNIRPRRLCSHYVCLHGTCNASMPCVLPMHACIHILDNMRTYLRYLYMMETTHATTVVDGSSFAFSLLHATQLPRRDLSQKNDSDPRLGKRKRFSSRTYSTTHTLSASHMQNIPDWEALAKTICHTHHY